MIVHTKLIEELATSSHNPQLFIELVEYLNGLLGEQGQLFESMADSHMTMIGYKLTDYKNNCYDGKWPIVSIAPQKSTINVYIMAVDNEGNYLVPKYQEYFGKSNCGKSCIRVRSMNDIKYAGLYRIISELKEVES
ncbi:hypothetical protein R2F61_02665 [Mollicutes bacterium LVI A0078]|nr:hypothetical protein RZE84_02695 [Mollicutes bacterium LVI A0075]WOO91473.1 hypothetical protein R2F61_02665 [Mollicutes bacterium LVI A0078]